MNLEPSSPFVTKVLLRQSISSVRLVIALFTVSAAVTKILYDRFLPQFTDLNSVRWTIIGLGSIFFFATYFKFKRRIMVSYFALFLYLSTLLYVIAFVLMNRFDSNAVILLILVIGASSVIINSLFYYGIQCVITILACVGGFSSLDLGNENWIGFFNLLIGMGVFGIVMTIRLTLISSVKNSYSSLEKLNVLSIVVSKSGEIVFVSPSAKSLLGYDPAELLKDGWWLMDNLRDAWISRDYIMDYPNGLPEEMMSVETSLVNKSGKKMWFKWANTMLPNGSYVGVALDITKYKL
jgi:PAS domain S-box-containing protein